MTTGGSESRLAISGLICRQCSESLRVHHAVLNFSRLFLRSSKFWRQNGTILRNAARIETAETPSVGNGTQANENVRKNSFLNYESPALTAELQAQSALGLIMRIGC